MARSTRRMIFRLALNLTIIIYCAVFYVRGYSIGQAFLLLAISALVVNLAAELPRRKAKRDGRTTHNP
jgi:hypothetical protein